MKKNFEPNISLFPMFNILICILGVLIFFFSTSMILSLGLDKKSFYFFSNNNTNDKTPVFMEWNGSNLVIHPALDTILFNINLNEISTWKETYNQIQNKINSKESAKIIFSDLQNYNDSMFVYVFVRQSGFYNFRNINGFIQRRINVDLGYELMLNEEKIKVK